MALTVTAYPVAPISVNATSMVSANGEFYAGTGGGLLRSDGGYFGLLNSGLSATALSNWNGTLLFGGGSGAGDTFYRLDPGAPVPVEIKAGGTTRLSGVARVLPAGDKVFVGTSAGIYVSDGTAQGTRFVTVGSPLGVVGGKLIFAINGATASTSSVWITDGTSQGTARLRDATVAFDALDLNGIAIINGLDGVYRSDGTAAGTFRISIFRASGGMIRVANAVYFIQAITEGTTLYKSDGTEAGTALVTSNVKAMFSQPSGAGLGDTFYFTGTDGAKVAQIYSTTGPGDVKQVTSFTGPTGSGVLPDVVASNGRLYFPARDSTGASDIWTSSGAPGNFTRVPKLVTDPNAAFGDPTNLTTVGGSLFFTRQVNATNQLWRYALSATALDADGTLVVNGSDPAEGGSGTDAVLLARSGPNLSVTVNGVVTSFAASSVKRITVNTLDGNDALTVAPELIAPSAGAPTLLTYNAGFGVESLTLAGTDAADTIALAADRVTFASPGAQFDVVVRDLETLTVDGVGGNDVLTIAANPVTTLTIGGGVGDDAVTIGSGLLEGVHGQITAGGGGGVDVLAIDDSANPNTDAYTLSGTGMTRTRVATTQTVAFSQFAGGVTLRAGTGVNVITVTPDPATPLIISGGAPTGATASSRGDALVLRLTGVAAPALAGSGVGSGTYTFANRQPVTFTGIEVPDDLSPPKVATAAFAYAGLPHKLSFRFDEPVASFALPQALTLVNLTTGQTIPVAVLPGSYNPLSMTQTYTFDGASQGRLPEGVYRATLSAAAVIDLSSNAMASDFVYEFTVLRADANNDGAVDFVDLAAMAQNYNTVGNTYVQGDFNGDGAVDFLDLAMLAQRYNTSLGVSGGGGAGGAAPAPVPIPTSTAVAPTTAHTPSASGVVPGTPVPAAGGTRPGVASDTTFGSGGKVITDLADVGISQDGASDAMRAPDGKLVVVGTTGSDLAVVRYLADGSRDPSFGDHGLVRYHMATYTTGTAVYVQSDGSIVVTGTVSTFIGSTLYPSVLLMRFTIDGTIDGSFGTNGVTLFDDGTPGSIIALSDGKFLVGGHQGHNSGGYVGALWRFNANGTVDRGFGTNGVLAKNTGASFQDTRVLVALPGGQALASTATALFRLNADGNSDPTFGTNGSAPAGNVALQPDGKIVLISSVSVGLQSSDVTVTRLTPDGLPDPTFAVATGGTLQINFGGIDSATEVIVQADGKILIGGIYNDEKVRTNQDIALARVLPNGTIDPTFGTGGRLIDPFDVPDTGYEVLASLVQLSPSRIVAVGYTNLFAPGDTYSGTSDQNIALAAYVLDPDIDVHSGGPYGPVPEGAAFAVSAAGTTYAGGTVVTYEWDYAYNGVTFVPDAVGQSAQLVAGDDPSATIALRVTTSDGLRAIVTTNVAIQNVPPTVDAGRDRLTVPLVGTSVAFSASDVVSESFTFTIDWGDGTTPSTQAATGTAVSGSASHVYANVGLYTVTVTADDGDGGRSSDTTSVRVGDVLAELFYDANGDNFRDSGELPLAGQRVYLDLNLNGQADAGEPTMTTNADGQVLFEHLAADVYSLRADALKGYQFSGPGATDVSAWPGGGTSVKVGFTQRGAVSGGVFNDANANGQWDPGEAPVGAGRTITLTPIDPANPTFSKSTDALGMYRIGGVPAGTYVLRTTPPTGWAQTSPDARAGRLVTVTTAGAVVGADFGQVQTAPATITGTVFEDVDGDGIRGAADKALVGRAVYVDANNNGLFDAQEFSVDSGSTGTFSLAGLPAGTYTVRLAPRGGWAQTAPVDGYTVTLTAGQTVSVPAFGTHKFDVTPPHVSSTSFDPTTKRIQMTFDEPIVGLATGDVRVIAVATNVIYGYVLINYDAVAGVATFAPAAGVTLAPATYRIRLFAGSINDVAGNALAADYTYDFAVPAAAASSAPAELATLAASPGRGTPLKKVVTVRTTIFNVATSIKRPPTRIAPVVGQPKRH